MIALFFILEISQCCWAHKPFRIWFF